MYAYLPFTAPVCVFADASLTFAIPKSSTLAMPDSVTKMFDGVMSRCTTPR